MMNFFSFILGYRRFELKTKLSKERVLEKVSQVEPDDYYGGNFYYSKVSKDSFKLCEKMHKRSGFFFYSGNAFAPILSAKLEERDGYTVLRSTLRMKIFPMIFNVVWLAGIYFCLLCIALLAVGVMLGETTFEPLMLSVVIFPVFHSILVYFFFHRPADRLKEFTEALLVCE